MLIFYLFIPIILNLLSTATQLMMVQSIIILINSIIIKILRKNNSIIETLEYSYFFILKFEYIFLFFQKFQKFFRNYKINQEMYSNFIFHFYKKSGFFLRHHYDIINSVWLYWYYIINPCLKCQLSLIGFPIYIHLHIHLPLLFSPLIHLLYYWFARLACLCL